MIDYHDLPPVVDVHGAAEVLGCSPDTVRRRIAAGELGSVRIGRLVRIPRHALVALLTMNGAPDTNGDAADPAASHQRQAHDRE